jgi:hypothetical protein
MMAATSLLKISAHAYAMQERNFANRFADLGDAELDAFLEGFIQQGTISSRKTESACSQNQTELMLRICTLQ